MRPLLQLITDISNSSPCPLLQVIAGISDSSPCSAFSEEEVKRTACVLYPSILFRSAAFLQPVSASSSPLGKPRIQAWSGLAALSLDLLEKLAGLDHVLYACSILERCRPMAALFCGPVCSLSPPSPPNGPLSSVSGGSSTNSTWNRRKPPFWCSILTPHWMTLSAYHFSIGSGLAAMFVLSPDFLPETYLPIPPLHTRTEMSCLVARQFSENSCPSESCNESLSSDDAILALPKRLRC